MIPANRKQAYARGTPQLEHDGQSRASFGCLRQPQHEREGATFRSSTSILVVLQLAVRAFVRLKRTTINRMAKTERTSCVQAIRCSLSLSRHASATLKGYGHHIVDS